MDAKSKANFINSVADGTTIPCPKCGSANKSDSKFCISCGIKLSVDKNSQASSSDFVQVNEKKAPVNTFEYVEPNTVFAKGLPEWSVEPPQIMVRRH